MQKSTVWLMVGIGATVALMISACCAFGMFAGKSKSRSGSRVAAGLDVDLEKLTRAFESYAGTGAKDINGFEKVVNDKTKKIYKGKEYVKVTQDKKGEVIGYVNKNQQPTYEAGKDKLVFSIAVEHGKKRVVARDSRARHYGYYPRSNSGFFTGMLVGHMLTRQRGYYGSYWRAPTTGRWVRSGYYNRAYRSYSRSSRYSRSGSSYRSSSRSRSGGFGFGK